jgi:CheY-like chemotaxis protein
MTHPTDTPVILTVDDSRVSRMLIMSIIREHYPKAEILEAGEGVSALALIEKHQPQLIILDMNMPGMSGLEVAEKTIPQFPLIKIALLTANIQEAIQERAKNIGIKFFKKPVNDTVISSILKIIEG